MDWECFSCFIKFLLSALWLVDDSAAFSLRYVLTRDRMTIFCFSVSSFCCSSCCLPCHLMVDTCALMDIRTSQAIDRSRRHHTLQFTFISHRSQLVVLWKILGCGAQFSVLGDHCPRNPSVAHQWSMAVLGSGKGENALAKALSVVIMCGVR